MIDFLQLVERRLTGFNTRMLGDCPAANHPSGPHDKNPNKPSHFEVMGDVGRSYDALKELIGVQLERLETIG